MLTTSSDERFFHSHRKGDSKAFRNLRRHLGWFVLMMFAIASGAFSFRFGVPRARSALRTMAHPGVTLAHRSWTSFMPTTRQETHRSE